MSIILFYMSAK